MRVIAARRRLKSFCMVMVGIGTLTVWSESYGCQILISEILGALKFRISSSAFTCGTRCRRSDRVGSRRRPL